MALRLRVFAFLLFCSLAYVQNSRADSALGFQVGVLAGAVIVNGPTSFTYGFTVGVKYGTNWNFGIYFSTLGLGVPAGFLGGYSASSGITMLMGEADYTFADFLPNLYLGAKVGFISSSSSLTGPSVSTNESSTNLGLGGAIGYGFQISDKFRVGPELNMTSVFSSNVFITNLVALARYRF